ncbi:MAG: hypothetical protein IJV15_00615 [Lachnospiraceae bacterium]|nr:hypothetical protein [Lachnospiraceae bacterium]
MSYSSYVLIILTLLLGFLMYRSNVVQNKRESKEKEEFWDREMKASFTRRADISKLDYITLNTDALPIKEAEQKGFSNITKNLIYYTDKKLLNLSAYSNTDLKLMYGPANLEELSEYDNNFNQVIRIINKLSTKLIEADESELAKRFLEYNISLGSDISSDFEMLGNIYYSKNDMDSFNKLEAKADKISSLSHNLIKLKLDNIKSANK